MRRRRRPVGGILTEQHRCVPDSSCKQLGLFLQAAFADINIAKSRSVNY
jgi:hypothetical protein